MKRQIRSGVFETNSSSVHTITFDNTGLRERDPNDLRIDRDGKIILTKEGKVALCLTSGNDYIKKEFDDEEIHLQTAGSDVTCTIPNIENNDFSIRIEGSNSQYYDKDTIDIKLSELQSQITTLQTQLEEDKKLYEGIHVDAIYDVRFTLSNGERVYHTIDCNKEGYKPIGILNVSTGSFSFVATSYDLNQETGIATVNYTAIFSGTDAQPKLNVLYKPV